VTTETVFTVRMVTRDIVRFRNVKVCGLRHEYRDFVNTVMNFWVSQTLREREREWVRESERVRETAREREWERESERESVLFKTANGLY